MNPIEWTVVAGAVAAIALVNWYFFVAGRTTVAAVAVAPSAASTGATAEVVIVVDGGYSPNTVRARKGERLRLVFDRRDDSSCSEEVVIPALGIKRYLPTGERTTIEVTPNEAGRIPFTCGMSMLRGTIIVDD
jgi:plastocyanin domain-containing protein